MKRKFKGYSLVELLASIAVLSIAMVGIIAIMSNAIGAYSNANLDVSVQEEAQIAANQIEEILSSSDEITTTAVGYKFKAVDSAYEGYEIYLNGTDLWVQMYNNWGDTSAAAASLLAKNCTNFSLDNFGGDANFTRSEAGATVNCKALNQTVINLELDNGTNSYALNRNVYFRNNNENNTFHDINHVIAGGGGGTIVTSDDKTLDVKRYQTYNLTQDFQIRYNCVLQQSTDGGATWANTDDLYFKLTESTVVPGLDTSYAGAKAYYLETSTSVNNNFNNPLAGRQFRIVGDKTNSGGSVTVVLNVDPVEIQESSVIQHHTQETVNGEGFSSPINVKGININEAIQKGVSVKYNYNLKQNGSVLGNAWAWGSANSMAYCGGLINYGTYTTQYNMSSYGRIQMGVAPDAYSGGLLVLGNNEPMSSTCSGLINQTNLTFTLHMEINNGAGGSLNQNYDIKFRPMSKGQ
ncbi:MAG: type II secretion system GspH family protein [Lachnospiraceae bacterium]|nr:type II secretion system GspH family protein [Lachnospiraceae bacterium]